MTLSTTGASVTLTITWKGSVTGTVGGTTYAGRARFTPTTVSAGNATGSFAGTTALAFQFPANAASRCGSKTDPIPGATVAGVDTFGGGDTSLVSDGDGYCAVLGRGSPPSPGTVDCWGHNSLGELGDDSTVSPLNPVTVCAVNQTSYPCFNDLNDVLSLATDDESYCAVLNSGAGGGVDCWGDNFYGELGDGNTTNSDVPVAVTGLSNVMSLVGDPNNTGGYCAVLTSGAVDCWGDNSAGELGNGTATGPDCSGTCNPTPATVSGVTATSLASVGDGYCAVLTSGAVDCWGDNSAGELGNGTATGPDCSGTCNPTPAAVTGISTAASLASDEAGYCAVLTSGAVDCWGYNGFGDLGNGTATGPDCSNTCNPTPAAVTGISTAQALASDGEGYCAVLASLHGSIDCWGDNSAGELGNGTVGSDPDCSNNCNPTPGAVIGVTEPLDLTSNNGAGEGYCVVEKLVSGGVSNRPAECWGDNSAGELGNGTVGSDPDCSNTCNPTPGAVIGLGEPVGSLGVFSLASDGAGYCAVLEQTTVDCWGANGKAGADVLGDGSLLFSDVPQHVN